MKKLTLILLVLLCAGGFSYSQPVLCEGLKIKAVLYNYSGSDHISVQSAIPDSTASASPVTRFICRHKLRFDYLIVNKIDSLQRYSAFYPDSAAIDTRFCAYLSSNKKIKGYVAALLPPFTGIERPPQTVFSKQELMLVAARFFLCDGIRKEDTAIKSHICVGLNGIKSLTGPKDYTLLAAFCFEAIFHSIIASEEDPAFLADFTKAISKNGKLALKDFKDFDSYLATVRTATFMDMEQDKHLENMLLAYFKANADGLGFRIR